VEIEITNAVYNRNLAGKVVSITADFAGEHLTVPAVAGNRHFDAVVAAINAGELTVAEAPVDSAAVLASLKGRLGASIDEQAEGLRLKYLTPGVGQSMIYERKAREAHAFLADPAPDPANYPVLAASIGIEGNTLADVAALVVARETQWAAIGAQIENVRLRAKAGIAVATTIAAAQLAHDSVAWPQ